ncbi:MAG TPA: hypothetical protein VGN21_02850 [Stellaceae bacterium]|jgi:hypothetical protein
MADPKQFTSGSLSQGSGTNPAASVGASPSTSQGMSRGQPDGSRVVQDAKEMGTEVIGAVREGASSFFEEQRNRAASEIAAFGEMLRRSARTLDDNRSTVIGQYAEGAADDITQFAERLRNRSLGMLAEDVEDFARQWPAAFMAAAVGAGFLAGRFLTSSSSRPRPQTMSTPRPTSAPQPMGGARHDFGAVGGTVPSGNAGYGGSGIREPH